MESVKFLYRAEGACAVVTGAEGPVPAHLAIPPTADGLQVAGLGKDAFAGNLFVASLAIAQGVGFIGDGAFRGCPSLKSVRLPASLEFAGPGAFGECPSLRTVFLEGARIPKGLDLDSDVMLRAPNLAKAPSSCPDGAVYGYAAGLELAVKVVRQAAETGCRVSDRAALRHIHRAPLDVLEQVMPDIGAVEALVGAVEDMPGIGARFEALTAMAAACSDAGLPEQAAIALEAASGQGGTGKADAGEGATWLML